jgi:hypothetical protein
MSDIKNEQTEDEMLETEISDESLEAAAFAGILGAYTEFAYCTQVACPLINRCPPTSIYEYTT